MKFCWIKSCKTNLAPCLLKMLSSTRIASALSWKSWTTTYTILFRSDFFITVKRWSSTFSDRPWSLWHIYIASRSCIEISNLRICWLIHRQGKWFWLILGLRGSWVSTSSILCLSMEQDTTCRQSNTQKVKNKLSKPTSGKLVFLPIN